MIRLLEKAPQSLGFSFWQTRSEYIWHSFYLSLSASLSFYRCRKTLSCFPLCICPLASLSGNSLSLLTSSPAKCVSPARSPGTNPRLLCKSRASWRRPSLKMLMLREGPSPTASLLDKRRCRTDSGGKSFHLLQQENILQLLGLLPPGGKERGRIPALPLRDLAGLPPWLKTACQHHWVRETGMISLYIYSYCFTSNRRPAPCMWWVNEKCCFFAGCLKFRGVQKNMSRGMGWWAACHTPRFVSVRACVYMLVCVLLSCTS